MRTYGDLALLPTFEERFEYLRLDGVVGKDTFGFDRYLNQLFYNSYEWKKIRDYIIMRDNGCDLGVEGFSIFGRIYIHHMNPINVEDVIRHSDKLINPDFLICTSFDTHNAIHYGNIRLLQNTVPTVRKAGDTCPWR